MIDYIDFDVHIYQSSLTWMVGGVSSTFLGRTEFLRIWSAYAIIVVRGPYLIE